MDCPADLAHPPGMDNHHPHPATQWRKRLERKGWISLRRGMPPTGKLVEYHVIWQGRLFSGRVRLRDTDRVADYWVPGSPAYLLERRHGITEGVWRVARDQEAIPGRVVRPAPW